MVSENTDLQTPVERPDWQIREADGPADMAVVRTLFEEYADWLQVDLCFQGFAEELAGLPGKYGAPGGRLLLATHGGDVAGGVGLRPLGDEDCEMKRLWVRPPYRGHGLGRELAIAIIAAARDIGYRRMKLDSMEKLAEALALYRSLGFTETGAYHDDASPVTLVFMELDLTGDLRT